LQDKEADIVTGILSQDKDHLIVLEELSDDDVSNSTYTYWGRYQWFRVNTIYPKAAWFSPAPTLRAILAQSTAATQNSLPFFTIEDVYEKEGQITNLQLRQEAYYEILNGSYLGRVFGSAAIWPFDASCCEPRGYSWQNDIDAQPSRDQARVGVLFRSREFWKLRPDLSHQVLIGGLGSGSTVSVAACTNDGQTCIIYDPLGKAQPPQVDMGQFSGLVVAWWFDPNSTHDTDSVKVGTFENKDTQIFIPPNGDDRVLVLDLASANLGAP
jgi:hypothetical protein